MKIEIEYEDGKKEKYKNIVELSGDYLFRAKHRFVFLGIHPDIFIQWKHGDTTSHKIIKAKNIKRIIIEP